MAFADNFMPVFDWTRTELAKRQADGATALAYDRKPAGGAGPAFGGAQPAGLGQQLQKRGAPRAF